MAAEIPVDRADLFKEQLGEAYFKEKLAEAHQTLEHYAEGIGADRILADTILRKHGYWPTEEYIPSLFSVAGRWDATLDYAEYAESQGDNDRWPVHLSIPDAEVIDEVLDNTENIFILIQHPQCELVVSGGEGEEDEVISRLEAFTRFITAFEKYKERKLDE